MGHGGGFVPPPIPPIPGFVMNGRWGPYIREGQRRVGRARRGVLRQSILVLLAEGPRNGYQIITALTDRTEGDWSPSPGAVYPALQQLTDEGLVETVDLDGQKAFQLTDLGRDAAAAAPSEPWASKRHAHPEPVEETEEIAELKAVVEEVKALDKTLRLIAHDASADQLRDIAKDIAALRRRIYAKLAEEPPAEKEA
jgi:DNA-binding PadR family transcriptional regulator